jgi:hypothetical protein
VVIDVPFSADLCLISKELMDEDCLLLRWETAPYRSALDSLVVNGNSWARPFSKHPFLFVFDIAPQENVLLNLKAHFSLLVMPSTLSKYHIPEPRVAKAPEASGAHYWRFEESDDYLIPPLTIDNPKTRIKGITQYSELQLAKHVLGLCDFSLYMFLVDMFNSKKTKAPISVPNISGSTVTPSFSTEPYFVKLSAVYQAAYDYGCE